MTLASQSLIPITKANFLSYYHTARSEGLKPTTIQSAFRKTGIWPLDREAIPQSAFEPSKNTTTQAAQPLPAQLPALLSPIPTPTPTPIMSAVTVDALEDDNNALGERSDEQDAEEEPTQRYHIEVPQPLPGTASRPALQAENVMLRDIIAKASIALEQDFAQMKLMELENERLRKRAFEKKGQKKQNMPTSGRARHMTAAENLDWLARHDWESLMKDVFKEAALRFKVLKKNITDYQKALEKEKKAAEREAKAAAAAEARALRARGRGRAMRGRRGRGRAGRGRGTGVARGGDDDLSSTSNNNEGTGSSGSNSSSESEAEIPIPRSRRQRPVQLIRARIEAAAAAADDTNQPDEADLPPAAAAAQPHPRPRMLCWPANTGDVEPVGETLEEVEVADGGIDHPIKADLPPPAVAA